MATVCESVKIHIRIGQKAGYHHFLLFPQGFPKGISSSGINESLGLGSIGYINEGMFNVLHCDIDF